MPIVRKKSKIFRGYTKSMDPSDQQYSSKAYIDAKKGRHLADLQKHRDKATKLLMTQTLNQSSFINHDYPHHISTSDWKSTKNYFFSITQKILSFWGFGVLG